MIRPGTPPVLAAVVALLLTLLPACAPKTPPGTAVATPKAAWAAFRQHYCVPPAEKGVKVKASLYYSRVRPTKRTNRTLMTLWGDFKTPLRLDVSASIGKLLAHIREDGDGLLVFYPSENKAYAHANPVLGATRLGMPFPFSLAELARVTVGDFSGLAPKRYASVEQDGTGFAFTFAKGLVDRITVDEYGRPTRLEGRTTKALDHARSWTLSIDRFEDVQPGTVQLPDKLTLELDNGEKGVLHIKSRELMLAPWPEKSTALALPDGAELYRLDNGYVEERTGDIPVIYEDK